MWKIMDESIEVGLIRFQTAIEAVSSIFFGMDETAFWTNQNRLISSIFIATILPLQARNYKSKQTIHFAVIRRQDWLLIKLILPLIRLKCRFIRP